MYIHRLITNSILKASKSFPAILVTGPRQSGKTTLLRKISPSGMNFVTLDDLIVRNLAQTDPKLFFQRFKPPLFIDEIQYAPNLLPYIKLLIDERATRVKPAHGLFWISGSQNFTLMNNVSESLAGRVAIMNLLGFSLYEYMLRGETAESKPFFASKKKPERRGMGMEELFKFIIRGSFPKVLVDKNIDSVQFYSSYFQTYVERDIRGEIGAKSLRVFETFMRLLAARSAQLLNMASLAAEVGVSLNTVKSWLSLLEKTFQIFILKPYHTNINKREVKTPKVYFMDTGLLSYLTQWRDPLTAMSGSMAGALFENWVIIELVKSYWHRAQEAPFYFYRTRDGLEVDLFCIEADKIFAAEVKMSAAPAKNIFRAVQNFKAGKTIKEKWLFSQIESSIPIDNKTVIFPAGSIF